MRPPLGLLFAAHHIGIVSAANTNNGGGVFLWMTDIHFDFFYSTEFARILTPGAPCNLSDSSPKFSAYGCDSSGALVDSAVSNAAKAVKDLGYEAPDFIVYTGDTIRHNTEGLPLALEDLVEDSLGFVSSLYPQYFPNVTVVHLPSPDIGNNDMRGDYNLNVTSTSPCLVDTVTGEMPRATNEWLIKVAHYNSRSFASHEEAATFACGGYMSRKVLDGLVIISLNTVVWSLYLEPPLSAAVEHDPLGQHEWLRTKLQDARENGYKVYISGHIAPILLSYVKTVGEGLWNPDHLDRYILTITEYQDVVAAQLFGHVHSNELRALSTLPGDSPPLMTAGSISPYYSNNPFFSIVFFDNKVGGTKYPTDLVSYELDLKKHSGTIAKDPSSNNIWSRTFETTLTSHLGMAALTNYETMLLSQRMVRDNATFGAYFDDWYMGVEQPDCTSDLCRRQEACLISCGFWSDTWKSCVDDYSNPPEMCVVQLPKSKSASNMVFTGVVLLSLLSVVAILIFSTVFVCRRRQRREQAGSMGYSSVRPDFEEPVPSSIASSSGEASAGSSRGPKSVELQQIQKPPLPPFQ